MTVVISTNISSLSEQRMLKRNSGTLGKSVEYTIASLQTSSENLAAANSRVEDADFAYETSVYVKNQIQVKDGASVLAHANMMPQQALALLK